MDVDVDEGSTSGVSTINSTKSPRLHLTDLRHNQHCMEVVDAIHSQRQENEQ